MNPQPFARPLPDITRHEVPETPRRISGLGVWSTLYSHVSDSKVDPSGWSEIHSLDQWENPMNRDTVKGDWRRFRGKVREQWGKLTDDEFDVIVGRRDQAIGAVQKRYGIAMDQIKKHGGEFERNRPGVLH